MVKASRVLDRVLVLEMVRVTEAAAVAASKLIGRGDERAADQAAVEAMRSALNELEFDGTIVIGEGERDEAPMLYIGEKVGAAQGTGPKIDIALDPLEGTTITAKAGANALAVLAIALLFIAATVAIAVSFAIFLIETRLGARSVRVRSELLQHRVDEAD